MKVIGAGYARTGTVSLKAALEILGVGPCLHPLSFPATRELFGPAADGDGDAQELARDISPWNAAVGWVGARRYRELLDAWPSARVLLSVRDPEDWYRSYASCLRATREMAMAGGPGLADAETAASDALMMLERPLWQGIIDGSFEDHEDALRRFEHHNAAVTRAVPTDQLLVYTVEQGWGPLCAFLALEVPDVPFPHLNDRDAFLSRFAPGRAATATTPLVRSTTPRISRLSTVHPDRSFSQSEVLDALGMAEDPFSRGIFERCGVERRALGLLSHPGTLQGRTGDAERQLFELAVSAVDSLGVDVGDVDLLVTASLFSLGGPTLAHRLVEHYSMDPATDKYHVVGVGCASAVPLIRLVSSSLIANSSRKALIVAADTLSSMLTSAQADDPRAKVIGSAIFGDGAAAAIIETGAGARGPAVAASAVHQLPGTLDVVHMVLSDDDSHLQLARELPEIASDDLRALVEDFLAPHGLTRYAIDHWLIHPGGRRILDCVGAALDLSSAELEISYDMLAAHGNTGTPSIFYVLAETIARRRPASGQRGVVVTVGPGVTVGLMLVIF